MKSKMLVALAMLFSGVTWAGTTGTVTSDLKALTPVSNGKSFKTNIIIITFKKVSDVETVNPLLKIRGLNLSSVSKSTPPYMGVLPADETNYNYVSIVGMTNSPGTICLLTSSNSTPYIVQGVFQATSANIIIDTNSQEVIRGKFTSIQVFFNYEGNPESDLLYFDIKADPLRLYQIQYSQDDMLSWHPIADLFGGVNNWMRPAYDGTFSSYYFMKLPPRCCYRMISTTQ